VQVKKTYNFEPLKNLTKLKLNAISVGVMEGLLVMQYQPNTIEAYMLNEKTKTVEKNSVHQSFVLANSILEKVSPAIPLQFSYDEYMHKFYTQELDGSKWMTYEFVSDPIQCSGECLEPTRSSLTFSRIVGVPDKKYKRIEEFGENFLLVEDKTFSLEECWEIGPCT